MVTYYEAPLVFLGLLGSSGQDPEAVAAVGGRAGGRHLLPPESRSGRRRRANVDRELEHMLQAAGFRGGQERLQDLRADAIVLDAPGEVASGAAAQVQGEGPPSLVGGGLEGLRGHDPLHKEHHPAACERARPSGRGSASAALPRCPCPL